MKPVRKFWYRFRSAVTGRFVAKERNVDAPTRTVKERVEPKERADVRDPHEH